MTKKQLMRRFNAKTDSELARKMGVSRQRVRTWPKDGQFTAAVEDRINGMLARMGYKK